MRRVNVRFECDAILPRAMKLVTQISCARYDHITLYQIELIRTNLAHMSLILFRTFSPHDLASQRAGRLLTQDQIGLHILTATRLSRYIPINFV